MSAADLDLAAIRARCEAMPKTWCCAPGSDMDRFAAVAYDARALLAEVGRLAAERDAARATALEEAAKVCEAFPWKRRTKLRCQDECAKEIRALRPGAAAGGGGSDA